jgi:hypothetical protein
VARLHAQQDRLLEHFVTVRDDDLTATTTPWRTYQPQWWPELQGSDWWLL